MKKFLATAFLAGASIAMFAQKTINDPNAEKRQVTGFHGIDVSGGIDLYLSQGEQAVAVSASEPRQRDRIKTEVRDGILKIWFENNLHVSVDWGNRKLKAYVSVKDLDQLKASGGSDVKVEGTISFPKLSLSFSGGCGFNGKVNLKEMDVDASGGSDLSVSGTVVSISIEASGGSDFKGYELISDNCTIDASGGSDVHITVNKELNAEASGGSDVYYKGNGLIRNIKASSSNIKKVTK